MWEGSLRRRMRGQWQDAREGPAQVRQGGWPDTCARSRRSLRLTFLPTYTWPQLPVAAARRFRPLAPAVRCRRASLSPLSPAVRRRRAAASLTRRRRRRRRAPGTPRRRCSRPACRRAGPASSTAAARPPARPVGAAARQTQGLGVTPRHFDPNLTSTPPCTGAPGVRPVGAVRRPALLTPASGRERQRQQRWLKALSGREQCTSPVCMVTPG
jgi:hypothetical protein